MHLLRARHKAKKWPQRDERNSGCFLGVESPVGNGDPHKVQHKYWQKSVLSSVRTFNIQEGEEAQGELLRGDGACAESCKDVKGLTGCRRTLISDAGNSTDRGGKNAWGACVGVAGNMACLKHGECGGVREKWWWEGESLGPDHGGLTCPPMELELWLHGWKATGEFKQEKGVMIMCFWRGFWLQCSRWFRMGQVERQEDEN